MENTMPSKYVSAVAVAVLAVAAGSAASAQTVAATITLPNLPEEVVANVQTNRVYVAVPNFGAKPYDYVTVIDGKTNTVIKNIQIPPVAYAIADDPLAKQLYVGGTFEDANGVQQSQVAIICPSSEKFTTSVPITTTPGDGIQGLAVNWITSRLFVANGSDNELDVVHWNGHVTKILARISLPGEPGGVAVDPFTNTVYVALLNGNVTVINGSTYQIITTTPVGTSNAGIAQNFLTGNVYTTNQVYTDSSTVGVLNAAGTFTTNVNVGNTPIGIDVDPVTGLVFVANTQDGTVSVINGSTNTVSATLPVSGLFVAANFVTGKVYVTSPSSPSLTVINE
jgi:YVTN family beta-propeller protein